MDKGFVIISQNIMPQQDIKFDMIKTNVTWNGTQRSADTLDITVSLRILNNPQLLNQI